MSGPVTALLGFAGGGAFGVAWIAFWVLWHARRLEREMERRNHS